jgi:16S rRNA (adenine1518-N6/adenine1519-N6)-dimethyltransferase
MRSVAVAAFKGQLEKPQVDEVLSSEGFGADARSEQLSVEQMQSLCEAFRMKLKEVKDG